MEIMHKEKHKLYTFLSTRRWPSTDRTQWYMQVINEKTAEDKFLYKQKFELT